MLLSHIDFWSVQEREAAKTVFSGAKGLALLKSLSQSVAQQRIEEEEAEAAKIPEGPARTQEDVQRIKVALCLSFVVRVIRFSGGDCKCEDPA